jgi:alpha,alpha-trehalase
MRKIWLVCAWLFVVAYSQAQPLRTPDQIYGQLFTDVQMSGIFPDSKTFVDCIPRRPPADILKDYTAIKNNPAIRLSLQRFVEANFYIPQLPPTDFHTQEKNIEKHIEKLWTVLQRHSDTVVVGSSLLPLPHDYIVPGGRFREIYYWDSYFTMLGLKESRRYDIIENMVKNIAYLIDTYRHMPNGNRSYYVSRSQPPFFSLMVDLLAGIKGDSTYETFLPALLKEYQYWMDETDATHHVVEMPDGSKLNRYWDQLSLPRQESYREDVTVVSSQHLDSTAAGIVYKHLRSAAESGWDFSSRWFADGVSLSTIETTNFIPVDLNALLYHLEKTIAHAYTLQDDSVQSTTFGQLAAKRKEAIERYCWSASCQWYVDYNLRTQTQSQAPTLAGMFPFFLLIADTAHTHKAAAVLKNRFLKPGGVVTTLATTGQQWDAPNGWAPLQWTTIIGLEQYGEKELAATVASRWIRLNKKVFANTGKLMEKYNVVNLDLPAGGGEYPSQDGFGWTNGVLLALLHLYNEKQ